MKELILMKVTWFPDEDKPAFEIYRKLIDPEREIKNSILIVDYNYTPWPRVGGNLLW